MELNRSRYHFNRRIVALVLFALLALSYVLLALIDVSNPNQAHPTEAHHEHRA